MKKIIYLFVLITAFIGCKNSSNKSESTTDSKDAKVIVYYFHGEQRCATCVAVQDVTQKTIEKYFAKNEDVKFMEIDFSLKENEALAEKYEIAWSSLVIVSGEKYVDLTDDAFANAKSNPEVLEKMINDQINEYLKN